MSILAAQHHVSDYRYDRPISLGPQIIRLRPAPHTRAHVQSYSLKVSPENHFINWQQDPFGNWLARIVFPEKTNHFKVEVDLVLEIKVFNPFDFFLEDSATHVPFTYAAELKEELAPYLEIKEDDDVLMDYVRSIPDLAPSGGAWATVDFLVAFNQKLNTDLGYTLRMEPGIQTSADTLNKLQGSCRDMAWLAVQILRHKGLATRFVSGYSIQLKADIESLDGPSGVSQDVTDLHAWYEVYLPGAGWIGLDPTSGMFTGEGHIPLCCAPNPTSAAPISGAHEAARSTFSHKMTVDRIYESRRVTKPFAESEWKAIDALGHKVDAALDKQDVRLTMGGEPTFVSLDDRIGDEWHFTALSPEKKKLGYDLFQRLAAKFANSPLAQHAQGKWYPGEILPRWAMNMYWRADGKPVWLDAKLLADPEAKGELKPEAANTFVSALADALGVGAVHVVPAYEDLPYLLWKEQRIPLEGELLTADLFEATERKRLQAKLDENVGKPTGYVLPLTFSAKTNGWLSNAWSFKAGRMMLIPGDSPVGLRLPLGALPVVDAKLAEVHFFPPRSPFAAVDPLPDAAEAVKTYSARLNQTPPSASPTPPHRHGEESGPNGLVRSALCAEIRDGQLFLFLPPLTYAEHYLDLIHAIEAVASQQNIPVVIEGYSPPRDHRIESMSVTPDPGVIEVNIQPARNWDELKFIINTVYDEARQARLVADKFMIDGKRIGTGGGNHIVMGASKPEDSPFLRRPDVLGSMITFWQNHPSLSYLFSGLYIGPTSQAPRIDEARHEALYELEIALRNLPDGSEESAPWLVDRLLRNLLVDLTGNTHRAEFCIDKLYSPDSDRGRLGLLEMRGFEMSPHPQMNLIQSLLIRALVAAFWKKPYRAPLVRWGTQLHDRYMLGHYVREDLLEVLDYLDAAGFRFGRDWFIPFFDFRFPTVGTVQIGGITLELKNALEPWPVMGEESAAGGTSRGVDSSVERMEVRLLGGIGSQHVVTCNGRRLPLTRTRDADVQVAGVRYKAWAPWSSLHPNLPVNTPLMFDVLDTRLERSLGGARYHVMHPGGRNYDVLPLNDNEAEGRRLSRFEAPTHTPGKLKIPPAEINPDYPHTLDLRWKPY
ncbi:transglutaminase-like superfamily protein [Asticcacaulis biprosthecium C19]|uniref:Transglutaminase-like superfamily protein n=1 Tax=Asticcacaulis biprosthecium C19 TaxID=715226 RepID=F4QHN2_9CAUL|nr:transglutaminase family protein [Asticcacaulis biprosthecium]EGF92769.1 transglutaminase-like superfamily protein [Asticcacaulis biprosthecium C19]